MSEKLSVAIALREGPTRRRKTFSESRVGGHVQDALEKQRPAGEDPRRVCYAACRFVGTSLGLYVSSYHDALYFVEILPGAPEPKIIGRYKLSLLMASHVALFSGPKRRSRGLRRRAGKKLFRRLERDGARVLAKERDRGPARDAPICALNWLHLLAGNMAVLQTLGSLITQAAHAASIGASP